MPGSVSALESGKPRGGHSRDPLQCLPSLCAARRAGQDRRGLPDCACQIRRGPGRGRAERSGGKLNIRDVLERLLPAEEEPPSRAARSLRFGGEGLGGDPGRGQARRTSRDGHRSDRFRHVVAALAAPLAEDRHLPGQWRNHDRRGQAVPCLAGPDLADPQGIVPGLALLPGRRFRLGGRMTDNGSERVSPAALAARCSGGGRKTEKGILVQGLLVLGILVVVGYSLYRSGKRTGSRKGYNVGRSQRRW